MTDTTMTLLTAARENLEQARKAFHVREKDWRAHWRRQEGLVKELCLSLGVDVRECQWLTNAASKEKQVPLSVQHVDGVEFYVHPVKAPGQDQSEAPIGVELRHGHIFRRGSSIPTDWLCRVTCTWFDTSGENLEAAIPTLVHNVNKINELGDQHPLYLSVPQQEALLALLDIEEDKSGRLVFSAHYGTTRALRDKHLTVMGNNRRRPECLTEEGRRYATWLREYDKHAYTRLED